MGLLEKLGLKSAPQKEKSNTKSTDLDRTTRVRYGGGRTKYGNIRYQEDPSHNTEILRENSRGAYEQSTVARGIVTRLVDNVINTGLSRECSPLWDWITSQPETDQERYQWERQVESLWKMYAKSTEADVAGRQSLYQIMRRVYRLRVVEGEHIAVLRYLNSPRRMSPIAIQTIPNDNVVDPLDAKQEREVDRRGGSIKNGIEYDSTGKAIAVYVRESFEQRDAVRIPFFGPRSGRRFVIHDGNFEDASQFRGFPELASMVYELDRLTEYDISELEAAVSSALWMGVVTADKDAAPGKGPELKPRTSNNTSKHEYGLKEGIETVEIGKRSLVMNNLQPGYEFKGFQPTRPNPNYQAFVEAFETRLAGMVGMPLSVLRQKFQSSYSAARAEILFFWNNIYRRRDDFATGFLDPLFEAWFSEQVRSANIAAPGFENPIQRRAWLWGSWNGISRPVVDPLKEVNAVEKRLDLGHTTGEKEAKIHNDSDFTENTRRLARENEQLAEAGAPLQGDLFDSDAMIGEERGDSDREDRSNGTE